MVGKRRLLILTGATASGKSAFLYQNLADLPLLIINADSRQVYRDLKISSASPTEQELQIFPHELYNFLSLDASFSAGAFVQAAKNAMTAAYESGRNPIICGGTYFYIHSLLVGLLPEIGIPPEIRDQVAALSAREAWNRFYEIDPVAARRVHEHNRVRLNRQLALCLAHGGPISALKRSGGIAEDFDILMLIFSPAKDVLSQRVASRVAAMFSGGILDEAEKVFQIAREQNLDWRTCPALTGIGIREFFEIYQTTSLSPLALGAEECAAVKQGIVHNTMQLIKRQMTWLRNATAKPPNTKTVDPCHEHERIAALAREFIQVRAP